MRVTVSGRAFVDGDGGEVTDAAILRRFDGVVYDREAFTDYFGNISLAVIEQSRRPGNEERVQQRLREAELENATRNAVQAGGHLRFVYKPEANELWVVTEYEANRPLSSEELAFLARYTNGQWSDGVGANFQSVSQELYGFTVDCSRVMEPVVEQSAAAVAPGTSSESSGT